MRPDDLNFAEDLALLSRTQKQMQAKTTSVSEAYLLVGLNTHKGQNKILEYNTENSDPILLDGEALEDVVTFTYLFSIIDEQG
ncbi:unnamed protein product [Schistosoma curassoni]|uniref:Reverse transcriptase domain-containing protein n=1 Tax=Schistosoma curassoni TaxID=6186 RepID=A0A183K192_9TREM|nr:unnamed protein product [Schistosoma curassoni]